MEYSKEAFELEEVNMGHEIHLSNYTDLEIEVARKLLQYGLVPPADEIRLQPHHSVLIRGKWFSHFVITCIHSQQTFFLKVVKEQDNFLFCNRFLQDLSDKDTECLWPQIVVSPFTFQGMQYYITTYIKGQSLDTFPETLPQSTWSYVADQLLLRINQMALLKAPQYSEHGTFIPNNCATILKKKLASRMRHPLISSYPHKKLERAFDWACEILDRSQFSQPTLIHMDIKPANIIYEPDTGVVALIDFEFARFGDIDYGWIQILLSGCNQFNQFYREQIVSHLTRDRINLDEAFAIPKLQCYLFYQAMCNLIYYHDRHLSCPKEMAEIFDFFIKQM